MVEQWKALFPAGTIVRNLTSANLWHAASRICTCAEPELRVCFMKLCSSVATAKRLYNQGNNSRIFDISSLSCSPFLHYGNIVLTYVLCNNSKKQWLWIATISLIQPQATHNNFFHLLLTFLSLTFVDILSIEFIFSSQVITSHQDYSYNFIFIRYFISFLHSHRQLSPFHFWFEWYFFSIKFFTNFHAFLFLQSF